TPDDAFGNIVDVGKAAAVLPMIEYLDCFAGTYGAGKQHRSHVRAPPWAIDGKEPEAGTRDSVEMGITVRHHLVGFLRRGIKGQGVLCRFVLRVRHFPVCSIDRTGRREYKVLHVMMQASFEYVQEGGDIACDIGMWIDRGVANARLG